MCLFELGITEVLFDVLSLYFIGSLLLQFGFGHHCFKFLLVIYFSLVIAVGMCVREGFGH